MKLCLRSFTRCGIDMPKTIGLAEIPDALHRSRATRGWRQADTPHTLPGETAVKILLQFLFAVLLFASINASSAQPPDAARGQMLYENHCESCHLPKIHARPSRPALDKTQLRAIVDDWRRQEGLSWSAQDTEDVVEYVSQMRDRRPPK